MPEADIPLVKKKKKSISKARTKWPFPVRHFVSAFRQNDDDPREMIAKPRQTQRPHSYNSLMSILRLLIAWK